jgi:uncharacterized protein YjeT (DUF2065 family)
VKIIPIVFVALLSGCGFFGCPKGAKRVFVEQWMGWPRVIYLMPDGTVRWAPAAQPAQKQGEDRG